MARTTRPQTRRRPARPAFRLEGLEARHLCSIGDLPGVLGGGAVPAAQVAVGAATPGAPGAGAGAAVLSVVTSEPAAGQALAASPTRLAVTFNEPLQAGPLYHGILALERLAADGTATPVAVPMAESLGRSGTQLIATLPAGALAAGHYRLTFPDSAILIGADGAVPAPGGGRLGDFTVAPAPPGPSLADAIDLGVPGPTPTAVGGSLDPHHAPGGAALYSLTLPAGRAWTRDAAVLARGGGDAPDSVLALFDSAGRPLATAGPGASGGPTLAVALAPGTYYLGVSGAGNVPGTPGGYDPAAGTAGTAPRARAARPFRLLVDAVGDRPITLQALTPDSADPLDPTPTGLTLQFSGALRFAGPGGPAGAVAVVDSTGRPWPLVTSAGEQGGALVSLQFRDHLAPGHYTVLLPHSAGPADPAGIAPAAPGQPADVVGTFDVAAAPPRAPGDFGVITPGDAVAGLTGVADLAPGASTSFRFVVESGAILNLQTLYSGGPLTIHLAGPGAPPLAIDPGPPGARFANPIDLRPGVYTLTLTAAGSRAVHAGFAIQQLGARTAPDLILPNGVGQVPAIELKLTAPATPAAPASAATAGPATPAAGAGAGAGAGALALPGSVPTPTAITTLATAGPGLFLTPGGEAVGRPAAGATRGEPVGRGDVAGRSARGLTASIPARDVAADAEADPRADGAIVAIAEPGSMRPQGPAELPALAVETEGPGWMDRLRQSLAALMPTRSPEAPATELAAGPTAPPEATSDEAGRGEAEVEQAGMGPNLGIGLAAVLAAHVVRVIRRRRNRGPALRGPHPARAGRLA